MVLATSPWRFVLPPAVDPAPFADGINQGVEAFTAMLDTAVAQPHNYLAFLINEEHFRKCCNSLAGKLGIANVDADADAAPGADFVRQAWQFNLAAVGMASTDITIQAVGEQLGSLRSMLATPRRLAHWPNMDGRSVDQLDQLVIAAVDGVFKQFWWLLSDTKLDGTKVADGRVQNRYYIDGAYDASLAFDALGEGFPMLDARYPGDSRNIWVFNTYCLALQLLGYRPAS